MITCPRCHRESPDNAQSCPQCGQVLDQSVVRRAGQPAGRMSTVVETPYTPPDAGTGLDLRPTPPKSPPPSAIPSPVPTPPSAPAAQRPGRRGHTVYMPPGSSTPDAGANAAAPAVAARRIVAILITYSWKPEGQVFPIREGRNLIGRGEECDIRIPDDPMLSSTNSHITFRQNFVLGDMVSMSGTDLNGQPVEEQFRPLDNHARIRTGSTHWHFVIVDPGLTPQAG